MYSTYLSKAYLAVFALGAMLANVITLALKMYGVFALATLVFQKWAVFAPVEVTTAETWRRGSILRRWFGWLALLKQRILTVLPTFLQWLLYGVQLDIFVGKNSTVCLCGEKVHTVSDDGVEMHLVTILVKLLQDSCTEGLIGRQFQRGEEYECVELFFSQFFKLESL
jgi:hypothetical protein